MLVELLALRGIEARAAYDGAAALDLVALVAPGLVLVDLSLPGIDGYEVARRIRGAESAVAMQLIAVTGWADPESRARALGAGFDDLVVKPVDLEAILRIADDPATSAE